MKMKKNPVFAIVDIETTGGFAAKNSITEIAIILMQNKVIIDEYQTLIKPEQSIPYHIQQLTGISNEMVSDAPKFTEVADEIYKRLEDAVFVAHNVNFDFSFIHHHLKQCGIDWNPHKLCTVLLSRQLIPNHHSYSLGNLCQNIGIPLNNRHRAFGDASATAILFNHLLEVDNEGLINKMMKKNTVEIRLPTHFDASTFHQLPTTYGVYLFKDKYNKIVYVGKANQIKKRVQQHFSGNNSGARRQVFLNEIYSVDYIETGSELMALLYECKLIKQYWPKFNRSLKQFEPKFDLISYQDQNKYLRLAIVKHNKHLQAIKSYERVFDATQKLVKLIHHFDLNPLYCHYYNQEKFDDYIINELKEKFKNESLQEHNHKFYLAMDEIIDQKNSYVLRLGGRNDEEQGYVYVKNDSVYAFGFVDNSLNVKEIEDLISDSDKVIGNFYMLQIVENYKINYSYLVVKLE